MSGNDERQVYPNDDEQSKESAVIVQPSLTTPQTGVSFGLAAAISLLSSFITFGAGIMAYDHFLAQKVVSVDIKGFILEQQSSYLAGKLTDEQLKASFDKMETVVKAIPGNKVVLMGDAVIQGVEKIAIQPKASGASAK